MTKLAANITSDDDLANVAAFLQSYCGIVMDKSKRAMLEYRIRKRMQECGIDNMHQYCSFLLDTNDMEAEEEVSKFVDAVTVNKTEFFREIRHFELLKKDILPALCRKPPMLFKAWSAACANGAEAYSIAMVLDEFCSQGQQRDYFVLGTDISQTIIAKAAFGCFPKSMQKQIPNDMCRRHLMRAKDEKRREFRIAPHIRRKTAFACLNLTADRYPVSNDYDLIFCRNVLIYFDKKTQEKVLCQLSKHLRKGGFLIIGHSETTNGIHIPLDFYANTVMRKT